MANLIEPKDINVLAESLQELVGIIRDSDKERAIAHARHLSRKMEALLPARNLEELGEMYYSQMPGMYCRVTGESYLGIILRIDDEAHVAEILNISPQPYVYVSDVDLVFPVFSEDNAWPVEGLPDMDSDAEEDQTAASAAEPDGYPVSFEEFIELPAGSTVHAAGSEYEIYARRTRKNRWRVDWVATEQVDDAEAWEILTGTAEDGVVICTRLGDQ